MDIDDTVYQYGGNYEFKKWGPLVPGVVEFMRRIREQGYRIMLFTSRSDVEHDALMARLKHDDILIHIDRVQFGKPVCDVYIDDRAADYLGDWDETFKRTVAIVEKRGQNL